MTKTDLLERLAKSAVDVDRRGTWPDDQIAWLSEAGVMKSVIPEQYGGNRLDTQELTHEYHDLAKACLTTCFILTQRNGACQRIASSPFEEVREALLPSLAKGQQFATVGISHLTTSRQYLKTPPVQVELSEEGVTLNGQIPWVTGASAADWVVTGGTCSDGRQVLVAVPTEHPGVEIQPFVQLMALTASETTSVKLENVTVPKALLIAGPAEAVLSSGAGGAGSVTTSTLALGVISRMVDVIEDQSSRREELVPTVDLLTNEYNTLKKDLFALASSTGKEQPADATAEIRQRCNSLILRMTQAALTMTKGAGYVKGHPVELAIREAMFFLVWSCPANVAQGVLNELACREVSFS
ncbi:Acyl-CoA dehydrogenase [Thalassoglobus neptunius]|uniref:Acyl-CoA dehydrogenase n=1 Tax=Thalassoglobus neptunius TaxID=1938619 RepID=A0A5C5X9N8_9PLAN|nr:acyl-CoA dehydrogenase family protein [Thalassoglobus neptunius]TWT59033.1 Acyl-CoA dehydrogenase [Thalassoglobus neptunius]